MNRPRTLFRSRRRRGYMANIIKSARGLAPGNLTIVEAAHDADCPRPRGAECRCEPEFKMRPLIDPEAN